MMTEANINTFLGLPIANLFIILLILVVVLILAVIYLQVFGKHLPGFLQPGSKVQTADPILELRYNQQRIRGELKDHENDCTKYRKSTEKLLNSMDKRMDLIEEVLKDVKADTRALRDRQ